MLASLLLSQGVPMLLAGDECRRTQLGNNNAYCQDNAISWFDWKLVEEHVDVVRFVQALIAFRRQQPTVRRTRFLSGEPPAGGGLPDISWFDADGGPVDWDQNDPSLSVLVAAPPDSGETHVKARHILMLFHSGALPRRFTLPAVARGISWRLFVDTAADSPADVFPNLDGPKPPATGHVTLKDRAMLVYVSD
jgi:glycogen operon protein